MSFSQEAKVMYKGIALAAMGLLATGLAVAVAATDVKSQEIHQMVKTRCSVCHNVSRIRKASLNTAGWEAVIQRMIKKGAKISTQDVGDLASFLAQHAANL